MYVMREWCSKLINSLKTRFKAGFTIAKYPISGNQSHFET